MKRLLFSALALGALTSAAWAGSATPTADDAKPIVLTDRQLDQVTAGQQPEIAGAACFVPCATIGRFAPIAEEAEPEAVALPLQTVR
jgi:hypothetical protein